jgi:hypothetical protein
MHNCINISIQERVRIRMIFTVRSRAMIKLMFRIR